MNVDRYQLLCRQMPQTLERARKGDAEAVEFLGRAAQYNTQHPSNTAELTCLRDHFAELIAVAEAKAATRQTPRATRVAELLPA